MNAPAGRILVVDDEGDVRDAISEWLGLSGFEVQLAASGEAASMMLSDAMGASEANGFDAIVCDVRLPGMDGLSFLHQTRSRAPDVPVILMTAHGDISLAVTAVQAGAFDFLEKPYAPEQFLATVQRAVLKDSASEVPDDVSSPPAPPAVLTDQNIDLSLQAQMGRHERTLIEASLLRHSGNISAVMDELELPRRTLNEKMQKHGLRRADFA
ncbi:MAG: response regulator [Pseudomonadota bacterium]